MRSIMDTSVEDGEKFMVLPMPFRSCSLIRAPV
jgi:hypothetical protein